MVGFNSRSLKNKEGLWEGFFFIFSIDFFNKDFIMCYHVLEKKFSSGVNL